MEFRTGYGAPWLDLLATRLGRYGGTRAELLGNGPALQAWLVSYCMNPPGRISDDDAEQARALRESLHALAAATVAGVRPPRSDVHAVQAALAHDRALSVHTTADGVLLDRPASVAEALGRLARQAVDQLGGPERSQLRACGDGTCAGIFLDPSGRRRWCSDERCGVRARVRAHRARRRTETGEAADAPKTARTPKSVKA